MHVIAPLFQPIVAIGRIFSIRVIHFFSFSLQDEVFKHRDGLFLTREVNKNFRLRSLEQRRRLGAELEVQTRNSS